MAEREYESDAHRIAEIVHEANRAYCATLGDDSQVPWDAAPEWQRTSAINGVMAVLSGTAKTPEQQHESWLDEKQRTGWVYGEKKDAEAKTHPCMVAYADLPDAQKRKDHLFRAIVVALTSDLTTAGFGVVGVRGKVPETVITPFDRGLYLAANDIRGAIKGVATLANDFRSDARRATAGGGEVPANAALAFRHLEDASMRFGKVLQALDGGVSVYDKATTVGA